VVLFGEHATVYNHPGISASLDLGLRVRLVHDPDGPRFLSPDFKKLFRWSVPRRTSSSSRARVDAALEMYGLEHAPVAILIESDLVPGMGLGSSAAFSVALCSALRELRAGDAGRGAANGGGPRGLTNRVVGMPRCSTTRSGWSRSFTGTRAGWDTATVLSGGVVWFRKGPPREMLPMRLPAPLYGIICFVEPGARTIDMVRAVATARERDRTGTDAILQEIGTLTVDAGISLGTGDSAETGALMTRNHELLAALGVSTPALDRRRGAAA